MLRTPYVRQPQFFLPCTVGIEPHLSTAFMVQTTSLPAGLSVMVDGSQSLFLLLTAGLH